MSGRISIPVETLERGLLSNGCKNGRDKDKRNDDNQTLSSIEQPIMHNYSPQHQQITGDKELKVLSKQYTEDVVRQRGQISQ